MFLMLSLCLYLGCFVDADYDVNYYNDYDEYNYEENKGDTESHYFPNFTTKSSDIIVNQGDTARLPCYVDNLGIWRPLMLWKRNKDIITVGNQIIDKNLRLEETSNGNTLVIGPASPSDEAVSFER